MRFGFSAIGMLNVETTLSVVYFVLLLLSLLLGACRGQEERCVSLLEGNDNLGTWEGMGRSRASLAGLSVPVIPQKRGEGARLGGEVPPQSLLISGASGALVNRLLCPEPAPSKAVACPSPGLCHPLWPPAGEEASYSEEEPHTHYRQAP